MIVLRGATSQWKRSRCDSRPIGPGLGAAGADQRDGLQVLADVAEIERRVRAPPGAAGRARCALRGSRRPGRRGSRPALMNSSRSTRGTTRMTA